MRVAASGSKLGGQVCCIRQPTSSGLVPSNRPQQRHTAFVRQGNGLGLGKRHITRLHTFSADASGDTAFNPLDRAADSPEQQQYVEVFPRLRERDSYRRLGVPQDASFEEVQEARNYLYEQYKAHEPSREAIELAFDDILQEKMKLRNKYGFKPPKTGRRTDVEGDAETKNVFQQFKERLEPSVPGTTIVNDGSIFLAAGLWSAWQSASADPTLPLGAAICYCAWRLFDKRKKRNPEGPYWGNSPVWGALGATILGLIVGGLASWAAVQFVPLPRMIRPEAAGLFLINLTLGITCIFFK